MNDANGSDSVTVAVAQQLKGMFDALLVSGFSECQATEIIGTAAAHLISVRRGRPQFVMRSDRSDVYSPRAWHETADGGWMSPAGRKYRPDSQVVKRVRAKLTELGATSMNGSG